MEEKLARKVCEAAGVSLAELSGDSEVLLWSTVSKWVGERSVKDKDLHSLARELRARVPHRCGARSVELQPQSECVSLGRVLNQTASTPQDAKFRWPRPQVLRRMQRLAADKDVQDAIAREAALLEDEKTRALQRKAVLRQIARQELAEVERKRLEAKAAEKHERELNNKHIRQSIEEAKAAERDAIVQHQSRCLAERQAIEEQRASQIAAQAREKVLKRKENEKIRRLAEDELAEKEAQEKEKAAVVKQSLVDFLNEGLSLLRKKELQTVAVAESRMSVKDEILAARDRRITERKQALEERRKLVAAKLADEAEAELHRRREEEKRIAAAALALEHAQKERIEKEKIAKQLVRQSLVVSLEEEISTQRARRAASEEEKLRTREQLKAEAEEDARRKLLAKQCAQEMQRKRKAQMDLQMEQQLLRMLTPSPT